MRSTRSKTLTKPQRSNTPKKKEKKAKVEEVKVPINKAPKKALEVKNTRSQSVSNPKELVYQKKSYVAFIDHLDQMNKFKIACVSYIKLPYIQLLNDLRKGAEDVSADVYHEIEDGVFKLEVAKFPIQVYSIIMEVDVTEEDKKKRLKLTKQVANKVKKLMPQTLKRIEDQQQSSSSSDNNDEDSESESESSDDNKDEEEDVQEIISKRKIVAIKKKIPLVKKPVEKRSKTQEKKSPAKIKASPTKPLKKQPSKKLKDVSEDNSSVIVEDEEMKEEVSEDIVMIDTSKKANKKAKIQPKVGQKRNRTVAKHYGEDAGDEDDEQGSFDEEDQQPLKKRKVGAKKGKAAKVPKKKEPKRPTEFKKGKWNPDIQLVEIDKYKEGDNNHLNLDCCARCNNKNIIRAAISGNQALLKKGIQETHKIATLTAFWSPEIKKTALDYMVSNNDHDMLEILMHPKLNVPKFSTYDQERAQFYAKRTPNPQYLMTFVDSGMVSHMAYGARVRKVQMTRGNRQGNNAFLEYVDNNQVNPVGLISDQNFLKRMLYNENIEFETYKQLFKLNHNIETYLQTLAFEAVRAGNYKIAYELINPMVKHPNFGFNQLHVDVLSEDAQFDKVLKASVQKKSNTNKDITPFHCACINPNPKFIKAMLDSGPELGITDAELRRPVHYAAACQGPEPLKLLLQAGASIIDLDNQKVNCLHVAAMTGRAHNVQTILETNAALLNSKDKSSMTSMAYACKYGHIEVVKVLLSFKCRVNAGCGIQRMTPLGWASAYGHYELCEFLLDNKARVLSQDKFKRTALIMAVRNGHTKIASLLLQRGSEWDHHDSSMNTPLHYAAGYGWLDCMDLLLSAGADVNDQNSWKVSPINIAMLKSHKGCVKRLLNEPNVDVNGKDEKGRTLLMLALYALDEESYDFIAFLLQKGANPNIPDLEGQTSLHYIAKYVPKSTDQNGVQSKVIYNHQVEIQTKITQLLITNEADLTIKDNLSRTPFSLCLDLDNAPLLEFLKDKVFINNEPELFFSFKNKIFNVEYQKILERLVLNDPPKKETINTLDNDGKTPFLSYIEAFTTNYPNYFQIIQQILNQQSYIYGMDKSKYKVTNSDIFDKFRDQSNYYTYNQNFNQLEKNEISAKFLDSAIVQPFIKLLKVLIEHGADTDAQVQKLKFYRDLEEQNKQKFAQLATGEDVKMETEEKVKKREEVLNELKYKQGIPKKANKTAAQNQLVVANIFGGIMINAKPAIAAAPNAVYETVNGVQQVRQYSVQGLRNAIHMLIPQPQQSLFEFLLSLKINPDQPDYDEVTPFNQLSLTLNRNHVQLMDAYNKFLDLEVRIDYPDKKGKTPFLNFYERQDTVLAYQMLDMSANVNQMDISGMFALKYALIRRQNNAIQELLDRGANINQIDNKGRNLLHHAINMSSATADATFETEQFLIDRGVDINLLDKNLRTPLHYAFVKIANWNTSAQIDPIETVSSLCGCKGLELDISDKWLKTPLHYASQRGASICAMYLIARGAQVEKKDIYGNTALGVGLNNKHYNYGIIIIQKQASVLPLVFVEDAERIKKQWEEEEAKKQSKIKNVKNAIPDFLKSQDVNMIDTTAKHKKKQHQNLFANQNLYQNYDGLDYDDEEDYDEEDDDDDNNMQIQQELIFNQQNAFRIPVYPQKAQPAGFGFGNFGLGKGGAIPAQQNNAGCLVTKDDKEGVSMFKIAIRGGQQGLAYLMLDNGYGLMLAMQDAMDEKKFMLVLTLLSKNPNDEEIQRTNNKKQNLFHILSMNAQGCSFEHLQRIYETLKKRGVDCKAKDSFGRTALHYAVINNSLQLVKMLLDQTDKYNTNEVDNEGHTPLSLCLQGEKSAVQFYNAVFQIDNIFLQLVKNGADVNWRYTETKFKPAFKKEEVEQKYKEYYDETYQCTPLINAIRQSLKNEILRNNIIGLIEHGAKLNVEDSDNRDPIMHSIISDNVMLVKILLENKKALNFNPVGQDKALKSAAHYVVNPLKFGSYENKEILKLLHEFGFNLTLKDVNGKTPAAHAAQQQSGVMLKELSKYNALVQNLNKYQLDHHDNGVQWPAQVVDFDQDADTFIALAHEREVKQAIKEEHKVPVDSTGHFEKSYQVYYDEFEKPWDVYLTKVDLKNGIYGDYVFYKMQLLYDSNRELYVVFTRWGRIGENGMNQRTPFNNLDEAKIEYKKIFKQKTGGNDFEELDKFARVKKKYNLTKVNYVNVNFKEYLQPFDFEKCPKSKLSQAVYDLVEEICNVTMYQRAITEFGIDTTVLPFSGVKKESLIEAKNLLQEIQEAVAEDTELSKQGIRADYDLLMTVKERLCELSSRYYELIPQTRYKNQIAPPLNKAHLVKTNYDMLDSLSNIEYASKMLLAALLKQKEINPIDYVHSALNLKIDPLHIDEPEYEVIRTYIDNTRNDRQQNMWGGYMQQDNKMEIANVFKIQRKGEADQIEQFKDVPNHFLLYHGSQLHNFIGILSQGLRIAPPEAPPTGYMFGKGVYFADMFDKSYAYAARGYQQQESFLMLMCEVVLGKSKELYNAEYVENLPHQYQSVKGVGRRGPGYKHTLVMPNGVKIPFGKTIDYFEKSQNILNQTTLQHNEYIVYNTQQIRMRYLIQVKKVQPKK